MRELKETIEELQSENDRLENLLAQREQWLQSCESALCESENQAMRESMQDDLREAHELIGRLVCDRGWV